jgi:hypothetical protein
LSLQGLKLSPCKRSLVAVAAEVDLGRARTVAEVAVAVLVDFFIKLLS